MILIFVSSVIEGALIGGAIGAGVGAVGYLIFWFIKSNQLKKAFKLSKGMSCEEVFSRLGEPDAKEQSGENLVCSWKKVAGKTYNIKVTFVNNILSKVSIK